MKELLGFTVVAVIMYLTFAFAQASFNIAEWTEGARGNCAFYGFVLGAFMAFVVSVFKEIK